MKTLPLLILCIASISFAEDFKTVDGKEYKDATVTRVEPDGVVVKMKSGISKLYFTELPKDVQERFHYDAQKATSCSAEQAANYAAYQKQEEQGRHLRPRLEHQHRRHHRCTRKVSLEKFLADGDVLDAYEAPARVVLRG